MPRRLNDPRTREIWNAFSTPLLDRDGERLLRTLLRQVEIADHADESGNNPPPIGAINTLYGFPCIHIHGEILNIVGRACRFPVLVFDIHAKVRYYDEAKRRITMRFAVFVKATKESEAGILPSKEMFAKMGKFNDELVKAGVMLAADGLQASSKGARVKFSAGKPTVTDGPFAETKELVAGFWLWRVNSKQDAIDWLKRAPFNDEEVELRQIFELEDLLPLLTPESKEQEERLRSKASSRKSA